MLNSQTSRRGARFPVLILAALAAALSVSCGRQSQNQPTAQATPQAGASSSPIPWQTIEPPAQVGAAAEQPKTQQTPAVVRSYAGTGIIRLLNLEEGWLEIDHEEIKDLMPAMQMEWSVRDKSMLKSVRVGDKVNFKVEDNNGTEIIIELKKAPAAP